MTHNSLRLNQQLHAFPVPPEAESFDFASRAEQAGERFASETLDLLKPEPSDVLSYEPFNNQVLVVPAYKLPGGTYKFLSGMASVAEAVEAGQDDLVVPSARSMTIAVGHGINTFGGRAISFMPERTAESIQAAARELGVSLRLIGETFDETLAHARQYAAETGKKLIHPYASLSNVAGLGVLGRKLLEDCPGMTNLALAFGGGSGASGIGGVVKQLKPEAHLTIAQAAGCSPYVDSLLSGEVRHARYKPGDSSNYLAKLGGVGVGLTDPLTLGLASHATDAVTTTTIDHLYGTMYDYEQAHGVLPGVEAALSLNTARQLACHPRLKDATIVAVITALSPDTFDGNYLAGMSRRRQQETGEYDHNSQPRMSPEAITV